VVGGQCSASFERFVLIRVLRVVRGSAFLFDLGEQDAIDQIGTTKRAQATWLGGSYSCSFVCFV
jgi:hypothetical protein